MNAPEKSHRIKSGWLSMNALRQGMTDEQAWLAADGTKHTITLKIARLRPEPPLIRVSHFIEKPDGKRHEHSRLTHDVRDARKQMESLRRNPPQKYPDRRH